MAHIGQVDIVQGTDLWHHHRSLGIGGSEVATILGLNPYENAEELFLVKTKQAPPKDLSKNPHVQRGQRLEETARLIINEKLNDEFVPATFVMHNFEFCRYSADGINKDGSAIIELKAPAEKNHLKIQELKGPLPYYVPQCQYGMMITGAKVCWFASYNQSFPDPLIYFPVYADKYYQAAMLAKVAEFWKAVDQNMCVLE